MGENREKYRDIKKYNRVKILVSVVSIIFVIGFLIAVLFSGFSLYLEQKVKIVTGHQYLAMLIFVYLLMAVGGILTLPLEFYSTYITEHRYGLSNQRLIQWMLNKLKEISIGVVIFTPLLILFYYFIRKFPVNWWIPLGAAYFLFSVILAKLGHIIILPIFYKLERLSDESLKESLKRLADEVGLKVSDVYTFNLSKETKKANAAFAGFGRTKRIILSDTLLQNFSPQEIEAVVAHEVGHYRRGHIWKELSAGFVLTFGGLFVASRLFRLSMGYFGGSDGYELSVLPLLALYLIAFGIVTMPVMNMISRIFERQADSFVASIKTLIGPYITALERLGEMNKADREPNPVIELLFYTHPSIGRRIDYLRGKLEDVRIG